MCATKTKIIQNKNVIKRMKYEFHWNTGNFPRPRESHTHGDILKRMGESHLTQHHT